MQDPACSAAVAHVETPLASAGRGAVLLLLDGQFERTQDSVMRRYGGRHCTAKLLSAWVVGISPGRAPTVAPPLAKETGALHIRATVTVPTRTRRFVSFLFVSSL